jgi:hypothetical protein
MVAMLWSRFCGSARRAKSHENEGIIKSLAAPANIEQKIPELFRRRREQNLVVFDRVLNVDPSVLQRLRIREYLSGTIRVGFTHRSIAMSAYSW